jgi:hypothetical protein
MLMAMLEMALGIYDRQGVWRVGSGLKYKT